MKGIIEKYQSSFPVNITGLINEFEIKLHEVDLWDFQGLRYKNYIATHYMLSRFMRRFVLAHELCHFIHWEEGFTTGIFSSCSFSERRADKFAIDLLCPSDITMELWNQYEDITVIAKILEVPDIAVQKKLETLLH